ncbi:MULTISPECIES: beta-agarase [Pseudoalteromonas]|uniref:beta-agarase n=1 Tax=Pseudoalteromonas TaxID=53246 RepID=UPI000BBF642C|nr:beta-agarase [Pseudoalteromonas sp. 1_2015MBL_MicDiv]ATG77789.1 beta-agarase [Pseudoalteromonas sp. 1_2015MBL_MicDiv]
MNILKLLSCSTCAILCTATHSADWDAYSIPASAGSGKTWQLQTVSDQFNYQAGTSNKPAAFTNRWNASYINAWLGPGDTEFSSGHSYTTGGALGLQATEKAGTNKVLSGIVSSKATFTYPLYLEAMVKPSNNTMANAVWMLSSDSTQEIDAMESYGSDRVGQEWFDQRMHVSHHVFIREPFQDYQPKDAGAWVYNSGETYRNKFRRYGVHWKDAWNLDYYIDGVLVRSVSGPNIIDPEGYTGGTGLNKPMHIILDMEHQPWRDVKPNSTELADSNKSIFWIDWVRVYKAN